MVLLAMGFKAAVSSTKEATNIFTPGRNSVFNTWQTIFQMSLHATFFSCSYTARNVFVYFCHFQIDLAFVRSVSELVLSLYLSPLLLLRSRHPEALGSSGVDYFDCIVSLGQERKGMIRSYISLYITYLKVQATWGIWSFQVPCSICHSHSSR